MNDSAGAEHAGDLCLRYPRIILHSYASVIYIAIFLREGSAKQI